MDKGLQIQVELHRKGEEIFSKIKRDIKNLSKEIKLEYLLSHKTIIRISDKKIWVYGIIEDNGQNEMCTVSAFENFYGSANVVKEAIHFYLINSEYQYTIEEELFLETERIKLIKIISTI